MNQPLTHGFTAVDQQSRPGEFVRVLDTLTAEPFYTAYKQRLRELLHPVPGGLYLDAGSGVGGSALALAEEYGSRVVAIDSSFTMTVESHTRGVPLVAAADVHRLPFRDDSFDGAWADRVLQHVTDPEHALAEMLRVIRPGGRIALADPDYDTQVLDIADQELARRVLRFRADVQLRNGTFAHQHAGLLASHHLVDVAVEARTLVVRNPQEVDNYMGLRTWAHAAAEHGHLTYRTVRPDPGQQVSAQPGGGGRQAGGERGVGPAGQAGGERGKSHQSPSWGIVDRVSVAGCVRQDRGTCDRYVAGSASQAKRPVTVSQCKVAAMNVSTRSM
ncbi:methyltransferase domain-containing protein [Kitasatospora sp. NPDC018058]|uniref:methyltransferase domain-containing protein n=1 Tax=Kitasatospora sp. NPDC018058 TaxID=3364025 RepID=UPI0037BEC2E0